MLMEPLNEATDWPGPTVGQRSVSVPPPSSSSLARSVAVAAVTPAAGLVEQAAKLDPPVQPDAAVRARLNAAILDAIIVGAVTRGIVAVLGAGTFSGDAILLLLAVQFLYFFASEVATGQTIGKRVMNVRVVAFDGSAATPRMCAVRNLLRFIDALPLLYASGLISLIRTGRTRRQRIGDVAAATTVVVGNGGKLLRTPRWLLPVTTVVATLISIGFFAAALRAHERSGPPAQRVATGFAGDNSQAPSPGTWAAEGTVTSPGYAGDGVGQQMFRWWRISRACHGTSCTISLTRQVAGEPLLTARLIPESDGWHATFPDRIYLCNGPGGHTGTWLLHSTWVLHFSDHGTSADAHERNFYFSPACGWATDTLNWSAGLSRMPWPPPGTGP